MSGKPDETRLSADLATAARHSTLRIFLIRHGRPSLPIAPRESHRGFRQYIDAYDAAGLDPRDAPPENVQELVRGLASVFSSHKPRAHESARALAPNAELILDPLFVEAPLAGPPIPLLRMKVSKWAVIARVLWHVGYHPDIETYRKAKQRAADAAEMLIRRAQKDGTVALVAHGYFNFLVGSALRRLGFRKQGTHRARFWNAVRYERD